MKTYKTRIVEITKPISLTKNITYYEVEAYIPMKDRPNRYKWMELDNLGRPVEMLGMTYTSIDEAREFIDILTTAKLIKPTRKIIEIYPDKDK